ncbi:FtsQ-type POTRA domain-containing protein [Candidatus Gracilibacteria bacterium]|nr:FtsQ-type POTRA domain-containing protein [Candidatus Gracilibacteria bacterium]
MFSRKKSRRRREFLLDSNQSVSHQPRKFRNRFLNLLVRLFLFRKIIKLFRSSVVLGTTFVCMAIFILFALLSPYFNLKKISVVRDNPNINVKQIEEGLKDFYGKNLLFLSEKNIQDVLWKLFPEFRDIEITEKWPSSIELKITVSPPIFNLLNNQNANFSVLSEDGVVLQEEAIENLPVIKVFQYEKPILIRQKFLSKEEIKNIILAEKLLQEEFALPLNASHLYWAAGELHLISKGDMALWIDLAQPIESQLDKLKFSASEIGLYTQSFDHIDLRIPKQIFWKYKE